MQDRVLLASLSLVIERTLSVKLKINAPRSRLFQVGVADAVKHGQLEQVGGLVTELRIELQQAVDDFDDVAVGAVELLSKLDLREAALQSLQVAGTRRISHEARVICILVAYYTQNALKLIILANNLTWLRRFSHLLAG